MNLLLTTRNDLSRSYFSDWQTVFYEDLSSEDYSELLAQKWETFYARDPFNAPAAYQPDPAVIDNFLSKVKAEQRIDGIRNFQEMRDFEDKFLQYEKYQNWMMPTEALSFAEAAAKFVEGRNLLKPRISQRAKHMVMTSADLIQVQSEAGWTGITGGWILQERMQILAELRVYAVFGQVIKTASLKSSKQDGKVKVLRPQNLTASEIDFCTKILQAEPRLDFVGLDIARLENDELKLIEVNRSPQFKRFAELTNLNLAQELVK